MQVLASTTPALATAMPWIQIGVSVLAIVLVLLQRSEAGLGSAFGGDGSSSFYTKRGAERVLFIASIVVGILFIATAIGALLIEPVLPL